MMSTLKSVNDKLNTEADDADNKDISGVAQVLRSSRINMNEMMESFKNYVKTEKDSLKQSKLKELYDDFIDSNRTTLEDEFYKINDFHTTVRGLKIRGTYPSKEEAIARSKKLQRMDPIHNIFVAEVGKWLPWDPEPSQIAEQEYAEEKLNTLMKKYKENEEAREMFERDNREKMLSGAKKNAPKVGMTKVDGAVETISDKELSVPGETVAQYESIFNDSGPPDLAIARKMENAANK